MTPIQLKIGGRQNIKQWRKRLLPIFGRAVVAGDNGAGPLAQASRENESIEGNCLQTDKRTQLARSFSCGKGVNVPLSVKKG
jgi:hypothetical protein